MIFSLTNIRTSAKTLLVTLRCKFLADLIQGCYCASDLPVRSNQAFHYFLFCVVEVVLDISRDERRDDLVKLAVHLEVGHNFF